jgi:hypothetical protein
MPLFSAFDELVVLSTSPVVRFRPPATKLWIVAPHDASAEFDLTSLYLLDQFASWKPVDDGNQSGAARWAGIAFVGNPS